MPHPNYLFLFYLLLITKPVKKNLSLCRNQNRRKKRLKSLFSLPSQPPQKHSKSTSFFFFFPETQFPME
ncbi:unnamed protein product [Brassica rapa subsp. narinosa]